ncbi:MAG: hypothetical protein AAF513_17660 [Pseudomonadota bacterium]
MARSICAVVLAVCVWWWFANTGEHGVVQADGSLAYPDYTFSNYERFEIEGVVLSTRTYSHDREAELSPVDIAIGWGALSNPEVRAQLSISQRNRWFYWRAAQLPIPAREINRNATNIHIIPGDEQVRAQLKELAADQHIRLIGQLVDVQGEDGWRWRSSRSRTDTGQGSCELLLLEKIESRYGQLI